VFISRIKEWTTQLQARGGVTLILGYVAKMNYAYGQVFFSRGLNVEQLENFKLFYNAKFPL